MKKIHIIASLILLFLGCAKQEETPLGLPEGKYNLALDISRAVEVDVNSVGQEQTIVSARMVVIATSNIPQRGRVTYNHSFAASELVSTGKDMVRAFVLSGQSDVYLIINEPADNSATLDKIENIEQLQAAIINFPTDSHSVGSLAIPMVQRYPTDIAPYPATTTVNTDNGVERLWAKVRVRFKATNDPALIAAGYPDMTGMIVNKVQLHNVPDYSYVIAQNYPSASTLRADDQTITKDYTLTTTATESADAYYEFYVPEFLGASADRHSFLKVNATTVDGSSRYYILDLKTTVAEQSFNLLRNTFYDITATIRGYGEGDVDVVTNVLPWNKVTSSPEVGEYLEISKPSVDMLEMDEEMIITYTGGTPTSITLNDALKDKIETTITNDGVNSGRITFKRRDVIHDGRKHSGEMTIQCTSPVPYSINVPVSIEQYSVNVGGTLTTSADGLKKYWSGGLNWATGNLVVKDYVNNVGMHISGDPRDPGLKFRYEIDWGLRLQPYQGVVHELTNGFGVGDGVFQSAMPFNGIARFTVENICAHVGKHAGVVDNPTGNDRANYWRVPTTADGTALAALTATNSEKPDPIDPNIRVFKKRLLISGQGFFDGNGRLDLTGAGGIWLSTGATFDNQIVDYNFMQIYNGTIHKLDYTAVHSYRCVRDNTL